MSKGLRRPATIWVPLAEVQISNRSRRNIDQPTVERYRRWLEQGLDPPPVRLARYGDAYPVRDGRHRVAAALAAGHAAVEAVLERIAGWLGWRSARRSSHPGRRRTILGMKLWRQSTSLATRRSGFDSRRLHSNLKASVVSTGQHTPLVRPRCRFDSCRRLFHFERS